MIILPQPWVDRIESADKFLKDAGNKCYLSSSVVKECNEILNDIYNWLVKDIRDNFKKFLNENGIQEIKRNSALTFERFFEQRKRQLAEKPDYYFLIQEEIEHWIIQYIKSIGAGKAVSSIAFANFLNAKITEIYEAISSKVEALDEIKIEPQPSVKAFLLQHGLKHEEDMNHLASAIQYQFVNNCWVVFVSFEGKSVLNFRDYLFRNSLFNLAKPDYAIDKLTSLLSDSNKPPVDSYRSIVKLTDHQERFVKAIKESVNVDLH